MSLHQPTQPVSWWETTIGLLLVAALQMAAVFNPMMVEVDPEEMFNAGQAWQLMECSGDEIFRLQYREFCGGCTLDALLGTAVFTVWERSWLAWKLVPLAFLLLMAGAGSRYLHRLAGRPAAWAFLALIAFPPRAWMYLSLIAWGNHFEAGCIGLCAMVLVSRTQTHGMALISGAVLGLCIWIGFSGLYATVGAFAWLLLSGRGMLLPHLIGGIALGLVPWGLQYQSTGQHAFVTIYEANESAPSLSRVPFKLSTLFMPRQLVALFGLPEAGLGWKLGWGWAIALAGSTAVIFMRAWKSRQSHIGQAALGLLLFGGAWLAIYCVVRFQVYNPPAPEIAYPGSARYAAPIYPMAFFAIALVTGLAWKRNPKFGLMVIGLPLLAGLNARKQAFSDPYPAYSVSQLEPVDWDFFKPRFAYLYDDEARLSLLDACETNDTRTLELHAYTQGRVRASHILRDPSRSMASLQPPTGSHSSHWWEGVGDAIGMHLDNPQLYGSAEVDSMRLLKRALGHINDIADYNDQGRGHALRAVAMLRMGAQDPWIQARNSHDDNAIQQISEGLAATDETIANAIWWAHGRAWAQTIAGFHTPHPIHLPSASQDAPAVFFEGLGHGLGERWGPSDQIPRPDNLPPQGESAISMGYQAGVARRWLGWENQEAPQLRRD